MDKTTQEYVDMRNQIVQYLKKGFKNSVIRRELSLAPYEFDVYLDDIKKSGIMTSAEINTARENKRQDDLVFIADCINDGLSLTEIREIKTEFSENEITPMVKELIEKGIVTQEQVDENRKNASRKTMNRGVVLSLEEQVQFILNKVRKGYSPAEIVKSDKTKSLTIHKVLYQKRRLIAEGVITKEEADDAMKKRQEEKFKRKHMKIAKKIREYTELGYTLVEISGFIKEYDRNSLSDIKNEYAQENGWYTKEELAEFSERRRIREAEEAQMAFERLPEKEKERIVNEAWEKAIEIEAEKRKRQAEIIARREARKAETDKRHQEEIEELKKHIKSGKTMEAAAGLMNCSVAYMYRLRKESIQGGTWLTEEEITVIQEQKRKAQEKARKKRERQRKREQQRKREENQFRIKKEAFQILMYRREGMPYKEIAKKMNYSVPHLEVLNRLANNIFSDEEDLKEFANLLKLREEKEKQKEEIRQKRELNKLKEK